jgi:hypothetical protein
MNSHERRQRAAALLLQGLSPSKIAGEMHLPLGAVMNFLYNQVGQGRIRRSDILFSIDAETRRAIEEAIEQTGKDTTSAVRGALKRAGVNVSRADLEVYLKLRDSRVDLGDMYEFISDIEVRLHDYVRASLVAHYGEENWWRQGVPLPVREDCAVTSERDHEPASSLYCYTTIMNLRFIIDREWSVLSENLPGRLRGDKQEFLHALQRLNRIRNVVMHPVKGIRLSDEDFEFVRRLHAQLAVAEQKAEQRLEEAEGNAGGGARAGVASTPEQQQQSAVAQQQAQQTTVPANPEPQSQRPAA